MDRPEGVSQREGILAAAYYQHRAALQVRRAQDGSQEFVEDLATRLEITADTLRRKLRGEDRVSLDEILRWTLELGIDIMPAPEDSSNLLP